jgi:hypothetical protein
MRSVKSNIVLGLLASIASVQAANAAWYSASYEADYEPENVLTSPQWQKYFLGTGVASGGLLTVTTNSAEIPPNPLTDEHYLEYRLPGGSAWNPTGAGSTFEVSFKTNLTNSSGWGGSFQIASGSRRWSFRIGTNWVSCQGTADFHLPTNLGIDSSTFHTYRFTTADDSSPLQMYVDGNATPVASFVGVADSGNQLAFGDLGQPEDGELVWDYIRWTNAGAIAPAVPEPGILSLTAIGFAGLLRRNRR